MASITYEVTLTSDGRPHVSVTSDDPTAARDAIPWLTQTYVTLLKDAKAMPKTSTALQQEQAAAEAPICPVHQVPMVRVRAVRGRSGAVTRSCRRAAGAPPPHGRGMRAPLRCQPPWR
jgi:hypothetical protein